MRLIDADVLKNDLTRFYDCEVTAKQLIDEQHTIIVHDWIPCSERMPEEKETKILKKLGINKHSDYVLVTVEAKGERMTDEACTYDGVWQWRHKYAFPDWKIVAWMPKPEPYKEAQHE